MGNPTIEEKILVKVEKEWGEGCCRLVNESYKHQGHAGDDGSGQTHFRLMIKSDELKRKSRVEAQRSVYNLLQGEFDAGLHALSLKIVDDLK